MKRIYEEIQTIELNEFRWQEQVSLDLEAETSQLILIFNVNSSSQSVTILSDLLHSIPTGRCDHELFKQATHMAYLGEVCYAKKLYGFDTGSALPHPLI